MPEYTRTQRGGREVIVVAPSNEELANRFAKRITKRWRVPGWFWHYSLSICWEAVCQARAKGVPDELLYRFVRLRLIDHIRHEKQSRRAFFKNGGELVQLNIGGEPYQDFNQCVKVGTPDICYAGSIIDHRSAIEETPDRRLLRVWCEEFETRRHIRLRTRVVAYLHYVEGMTQADIAETFHLVKSRVSQIIKEFCSEVGRGGHHQQQGSFRVMPTQGDPEECPGRSEGEGAGIEVEHAGDAAPKRFIWHIS